MCFGFGVSNSVPMDFISRFLITSLNPLKRSCVGTRQRISDVLVANEPILLNGSLVRMRGTESYLLRAVLVIVQSLVRTHCLPKSTRLLKRLNLFPKRIL